MVKSVLLNDEIHELLIKKQKELKFKKVSITLSDLAGMAIDSGLNNIIVREPSFKKETINLDLR